MASPEFLSFEAVLTSPTFKSQYQFEGFILNVTTGLYVLDSAADVVENPTVLHCGYVEKDTF